MKVEEKLALCAIKPAAESHIALDLVRCRECADRVCLRACPAGLYTEEAGLVIVDHKGCLECGTCLVVCACGAITWAYPPGGAGIRYRHG